MLAYVLNRQLIIINRIKEKSSTFYPTPSLVPCADITAFSGESAVWSPPAIAGDSIVARYSFLSPRSSLRRQRGHSVHPRKKKLGFFHFWAIVPQTLDASPVFISKGGTWSVPLAMPR